MASSSSSSSPEISHAAPSSDSYLSYASLDDVLEELSTRFIMNLPDQELESVERMCFQVEQAHWYYEDFMREANPKLPTLQLKRFSFLFFNSCPLLRRWAEQHDFYYRTFIEYKVRVPVCGAIMLNDKWDKCVLVKGWKSSAGWGFPKGKINQDEPAHQCAIREVAEETGFNLSSMIRPEDNLEMTIREQKVTLFIVGGVPEDYPFQTRTRKEISKIEWFKLSDLPSWKRNKQVPGKYYLISPFVNPLKEFIRANKPTKRRQNRRKNVVDTPTNLVIQTDFEAKNEVEDTQEHQVSLRAVSLDRDVHGYSSSSVDNGEPQTPSPLSTEAIPVSTVADVEGKPDLPMDPHFARLLSGLSLSASKPSLNGDSELRPTSVTPTSAKSSLASATEKSKTALELPNIPTTERARSPLLQSLGFAEPLLSLFNSKSPSDSTRSDSSAVTARPQSARPTPSEPIVQPPASDRHLKHLALLESVAQELPTPSSVPTARQFVHPGPPQSVPPFGSDGRPIQLGGLNSFGAARGPVHLNGTGLAAPPMPNDPFTIRPMTSQALFPPPPSVRRHGPNASMHQGSLLSILSGPNGLPTNGPAPFHPIQQFGPMNGHGSIPFAASAVPPPSFAPPMHGQTLAPQPLRVMAPPAGSFQHNNGPLTAPLSPPTSLSQQHLPHASFNAPGHAHKAPPPNAAHLLSLLNFNNGIVRPSSMLHADATRPNYPTGSSSAPLH